MITKYSKTLVSPEKMPICHDSLNSFGAPEAGFDCRLSPLEALKKLLNTLADEKNFQEIIRKALTPCLLVRKIDDSMYYLFQRCLEMGRTIPKTINERERLSLLTMPNERYASGERNRMMIQLMFNTGLRLAELCALRWSDIDFDSDRLLVKNGKGAKDRILFVKDNNFRGENDKAALLNWQARQAEALGYQPEHVFTTLSKGKGGTPLKHRYVQEMITRYCRRAGISAYSPHSLRHTFASDLYRKTRSLAVVKASLGHTSLKTTEIYIHTTSCDVEDALAGRMNAQYTILQGVSA